jgi:hypothetical protein
MNTNPPPLINTPLQRGVRPTRRTLNRFSGLSDARETVKTVSMSLAPRITPLKRCVNERLYALMTLGQITFAEISTLETP